MGLQGGGGVFGAGPKAQFRRRGGGVVLVEAARSRQFEPLQRHPWRLVQPVLDLRRFQEQPGGGQQRAFEVVTALLEADVGLAPEIVQGGVDRVLGKHQGVFRQIVEQRARVFEKQRQVILDPAGRQTLGNILIEGTFGRRALETGAEAPPETGDGVLVHGEFTARQQADFLHLVLGTLGLRIEGADGLHFLVEQVDAVGHIGAHGEQIQQRAAHGEFTVLEYLADADITRRFQAFAGAVRVQEIALADLEYGAVQPGSGRQPVGQRGGGDDENAPAGLRQGVQGQQALADDVLMRREHVIGQGFPIRQAQHRQVGAVQEETQRRFQPPGGLRVPGHHQTEPRMGLRRPRYRQGVRRSVQFPPVVGFTGVDGELGGGQGEHGERIRSFSRGADSRISVGMRCRGV